MRRRQQMKLAVPNSQIAARIAADPNFHNASGEFDPEAVPRDPGTQRHHGSRPMSRASASSSSARLSLTNAGGNFTPPKTLIEAVYKHRNEQRDARYFVVRPQARGIPAPGEADLKKFYEENPQQYTSPEYRTIAVIKAEPEDLAAIDPDHRRRSRRRLREIQARLFHARDPHHPPDHLPHDRGGEEGEGAHCGGRGFSGHRQGARLERDRRDARRRPRARRFPTRTSPRPPSRCRRARSAIPSQGKLSIVLLKVTKITPEKQSDARGGEGRAHGTACRLEKAARSCRSIYDYGRGRPRRADRASRTSPTRQSHTSSSSAPIDAQRTGQGRQGSRPARPRRMC